MKRIAIGLAAALLAGVLAPVAVISAGKDAAIDKASLAAGMKDAPPLATAADLPCTITEARFIGEGKDPKTKVVTKAYEVACQQGMGFVLTKASDQEKPLASTCVDTGAPGPDGKPTSLACKLAANADPKAGFAPFVAKSGLACVIEKARGIGASPTNSFYELACQGGAGYILQASYPADVTKDVLLTTCLAYDAESKLNCTLSDRAAQLKVVDTLAAKSGKSCAIKDRRYMLTTKDGSNYFEAACDDGKGYVFEQTVAGDLKRTIDCVNAEFVGGGCKLTDARAAQTEQNGLYSKLAKKVGYDCAVEKYGPLSGPAGVEVVELKCSNRPDGAIALFTAAGGKVLDCAHSEMAGYRCAFTKAEAAYGALTKDLNTLGKASCIVSNARYVGTAADGRAFTEVACSDGAQGYMVEFSPKPELAPKSVVLCSQATGIAGGCKLPGNVKKS